MPDGKVYFATASSVIANGRPVGRVCVMRDVTHFKELDALKSDSSPRSATTCAPL